MFNSKQLEQAIKRVADTEIEAAREHRDESIKNFPGEQDMISMFRDDCRQRIKAAQLAKKGYFQEAFNKVNGLDTAARDVVTDEFWDMLTTVHELLNHH